MIPIVTLPALWLQVNMWEMVLRARPLPMAVLIILVVASVVSWTVAFGKWKLFKQSRQSNKNFLRAFRKSPDLQTVVVSSEQFRPSPLVAVFDFGYEEVARQVKARGAVTNKLALERSLQLAISEELARLERHMNLLATVASVSPFVGLFGTVWGIIDAFQGLGAAGAVTLRAVAPGISEALIATGMGLAAAIPAAVFFNHYSHEIREIGARMDDFSLEFLNLAERNFED